MPDDPDVASVIPGLMALSDDEDPQGWLQSGFSELCARASLRGELTWLAGVAAGVGRAQASRAPLNEMNQAAKMANLLGAPTGTLATDAEIAAAVDAVRRNGELNPEAIRDTSADEVPLLSRLLEAVRVSGRSVDSPVRWIAEQHADLAAAYVLDEVAYGITKDFSLDIGQVRRVVDGLDVLLEAGPLQLRIKRIEMGDVGSVVHTELTTPVPERRPIAGKADRRAFEVEHIVWTGFDQLRDDAGLEYLAGAAEAGISRDYAGLRKSTVRQSFFPNISMEAGQVTLVSGGYEVSVLRHMLDSEPTTDTHLVLIRLQAEVTV